MKTKEELIEEVKEQISNVEGSIQTLKYSRESVEAKLDGKKDELQNFTVDPEDYEEEFCDFLDEEEIHIGSITFLPSEVLKEMDPVAYRYALQEWAENLDIESLDEYVEIVERIEELEEELNELDEEISQLEDEIIELEEKIEEIKEEEESE